MTSHASKTSLIVALSVVAAMLVVAFAVAIGLGMTTAARKSVTFKSRAVPRLAAAPTPVSHAFTTSGFDPLAPPPSCHRTVIVEVSSGTGNVLFKLAHALALCHIHRAGLQVYSPAGPDFASGHAQPKGLFRAFAARLLNGPVPKNAVAWDENSDWGLGLLDKPWPGDNPHCVFVTGTQQCTEQLDRAGAICALAALLVFSDKDRAASYALLSTTPSNARNVCLHVRRGDYLHAHLNNAFTQLTPAYYTQCVRRITGVTRVCVFSDDLPWCREQPWLSGLPNVWFEPNGQSVTATLLSMSVCDCFVVSNSTFALWGALLAYARAPNTTFTQVPQHWFTRGPYNVRRMYPAHANWVRVDDTTGEMA